MVTSLSSCHRRQLLVAAVLVLSSAAAMALVAFRVFYSGTGGYAFMPWNLFLAWVPLWLAIPVAHLARARRVNWPALSALTFAWLLFFPNAPYLVTEFIHLSPHHAPAQRPIGLLHGLSPHRAVPPWYDAILIFACAWNGLLLGFVSLRIVQATVRRLAGSAWGWAAVVAVIGLGSFGVSLGRFQRWNSWDLFSQPLALLADVTGRVLNPLDHPRTTAVTVLMSGVLVMVYVGAVVLGDGRDAEGRLLALPEEAGRPGEV